jgi:hypothetical protein
MTLNGQRVSDSVLDPGFSTVPSWRMLYRAFDVTSLMLPVSSASLTSSPSQQQVKVNEGGVGAAVEHVVGVRLGQGKYGYLESYCTPSDAWTHGCRAFLLCLSVKFTDGSTENFTSSEASGAWTATSESNPVFYTHLFHGEMYGARFQEKCT